MKPRHIDVVNQTLAIVWDDGHESYLELRTVRLACPCAACQGERNILSINRPLPKVYTPASFELTRLNPVGTYAVQPVWRDGHDSGIYSFELLRQLETSP